MIPDLKLIFIPKRFVPTIQRIMEWHSKTYRPSDIFEKSAFDRVFDKLRKEYPVQAENDDLRVIYSCVQDASNHREECDVDEQTFWDIFDWITAERNKL